MLINNILGYIILSKNIGKKKSPTKNWGNICYRLIILL